MGLESPLELFSEHFQTVNDRWNKALDQCGFDSAIIFAGAQRLYFHDDHGQFFKTNPNLMQWMPHDVIPENSCLIVLPGEKPRLMFYRPLNFWHAPAKIPVNHGNHFEVELFEEASILFTQCRERLPKNSNTAFIGEPLPEITSDIKGCATNPSNLIHYLYFQRASKTPYELRCMENASKIGVQGHLAAANAFLNGATEFEINLKYLEATAHNEPSLPYGNIIAQNEHASLLHYQYQDRSAAAHQNSLLIDAGANFNGYASDITRTYVGNKSYSKEAKNLFSELINSMHEHQKLLVQAVRKGSNYLELHRLMHKQLAELLAQHKLIKCSAEEGFTQGITESFCPHGLGHLLGIQVHDVGGHQINLQGEQAPPPSSYSALRLTRPLDTNMVLTIEPGLYFIPSLLKQLKQSSAAINWQHIEALTPFGGIRIEDNICVTEGEALNLTRNAFAEFEEK